MKSKRLGETLAKAFLYESEFQFSEFAGGDSLVFREKINEIRLAVKADFIGNGGNGHIRFLQ